METPPSGWYPDPYGVPGLLRWWDGSTWTQHTHSGTALDSSGTSGPATSLDATRIGGKPGAAAGDGGPKTTIDRVLPQPTTVQPATVRPTTVQPATAPPRTGSSWPEAGRPGGHRGGQPPYGEAEQFGTQVLPLGDVPWHTPAGGQPGRPGWLGHDPVQRRQRLLIGGALIGGTAVALALIGLVVSNLSSSGSSSPAASSPAATPAATASAQPSTASPTAPPTQAGLTDSVSGLSYALLASPWTNGCPAALSNQQTLTWTAGESAAAGQFNDNGTETTWLGKACSAPLPQQYGYTGVADLQPTAMNLVNQFDGPYYGSLNHQRTPMVSTPISISGHPAWEIKYLETYPDAATMGLPFNSEEAAVVVADQGTGLPPAVFFVSVPSNLGVTNVDALVSSLTLTVIAPTQSATSQGDGGQPTQQPGGGGDNNP
jgi:hypothetical protein